MLGQTEQPLSTPEHIDVFAHTDPGTPAGRYLRQFWHPICLAREVAPGQARPARMMGEDFAVFRKADGTPHVVDAHCPHRGALLWLGQVENDGIRCPYHGWKFDCSGQCIDRPLENPAQNQSIAVKSYPTEEYLGLVFVYLGKGEPPPLPRFAIHEEETRIRRVNGRLLAHNYFQELENLCDPAHVPFVHNPFFDHAGGKPKPVRVARTAWGLAVSLASPWPGVAFVGMPNLFQIGGAISNPGSLSTAWIVPVDDENCRRYFLSSPLAGTASEGRSAAAHSEQVNTEGIAATQRILSGEDKLEDYMDRLPGLQYQGLQDQVIVGSQGRIANRARERLGASDKAIVALRRLWKAELEAQSNGAALTPWTWSPELARQIDTDWDWDQSDS